MPSSYSRDKSSADVIALTALADTQPQTAWPEFTAPKNTANETPDHFIQADGYSYAGSHLIIDLWDAERLDELALMEQAMREAVDTCGATLLHIHLHHFTPNGGISGVAVLAESHISVHTWPEKGYAAFDVFMCGDAQPHKAVDVLKAVFTPKRVNVLTELRGIKYDA